MNNQAIGLLLVAGAAFLFLRSKSRSLLEQSGGWTEQPPPDGAGSGSGTEERTQGPLPPDEVSEQAALYPDKAHLTGDFRFNWHEWNYYRAQAAIKAGLCDPPCAEYAPVLGERFGLTDSQGLTAAEYHSYLSQLGMSGLSAWRYRTTYRRPWQ